MSKSNNSSLLLNAKTGQAVTISPNQTLNIATDKEITISLPPAGANIQSITINSNPPIQMGHNGGNLILRAGIGVSGGQWVDMIRHYPNPVHRGIDGSIIFKRGDDTEFMRFDPDGKVTVRGEVVDDNKDVYLEFREWLNEILCSRIHDE